MHGFKAARERLAYADGGLIGGIKARFFGPEETVSQKFARQDAERAAKAAAKAGAAPAPAPAQAPAGQGISGYAGMSAMQRREKEAGLKDGGIIRGPGTGTSDSIEAEMDEGTYIMPADSTQALGFNPIARLAGQKQKVRVSNGETEITPEQVHDIGAMVLDVVKTLTHVPTPEQEPEGAYAEGGLVEDTIERGRRAAPYVNHRPYTPPAPPPVSAVATVPPPAYQPNFTMGAAATGAPDPVSDVRPKYNPANATPEARAWQAERAAQRAAAAPAPAAAAPAAPASPAATPAARAPGPVARAAQRVGGAASAVGRGVAPLLLGGSALATGTTPTEDYEERFGFDPSTSDSPGARFVRDLGVRTLGAASDLGNAFGFGLPSMLYRDRQAQASAAPAAPTGAPAPAQTAAARLVQTDVQRGGATAGALQARDVGFGVRRIDGGSSPLFTNVPDAADNAALMARGAPSAQNLAALDALAGRQQAESEARVRAGMARDQLARETADAQAINRTVADRYFPADREQRNARRLRMEEGRAVAQTEAERARVQNDNARTANDTARLGFESRTSAADAAYRDMQTASAAQILAAQRRLAAATTPEAKAAAESEILALQGRRDNPQRFTVVPGGQEIDQTTGLPVRRPDRVLNNQTGQFVDQPAPKSAKLPPKEQLVKGQTYQTPRGPAVWDGSKFTQ